MRDTTELTRDRRWPGLVLVVGVCFGVGVAAGFVISPKREGEKEMETRAAAPPISAMVVPAMADANVGDFYECLKGVGTEGLIREMKNLPAWDWQASEGQAKWLAFAIRWVLEDAEGGADYLTGQPEEGGLMGFARLYFEVWGVQDFDAAMACAERLDAAKHPDAYSFKHSCREGAAEADPGALLARLGTRGDAGEIGPALRQLARHDPRQALAYFRELESGDTRAAVADEIAREWARRDPVAAWDWAHALPESERHEDTLRAVIDVWGEKDAKAALRAYEEARGAGLISEWMAPSGLGIGLIRQDPLAALHWIGSLAEKERNPSWVGNLRKALPRDPAAFHELLETLAPGEWRDQVAKGFPVDLGDDPASLPGRFVSLPDDAITGAMLVTAVSWAMGVNPQGTLASILELPEGIRLRAARSVFAHVGNFTAMADAVAFARAAGVTTLPDAFIADSGRFEDVREVADFILTSPTLPEERALRNMIAAWRFYGLESGAAWSATIKDDAFRATVTDQVVAWWTIMDPIAASEWVAGTTDGVAREAGSRALAHQLVEKDPSAAFAWALTVRDSEERERLVEKAYRRWALRSPAEAAEALTRANLPEATRNALRNEP